MFGIYPCDLEELPSGAFVFLHHVLPSGNAVLVVIDFPRRKVMVIVIDLKRKKVIVIVKIKEKVIVIVYEFRKSKPNGFPGILQQAQISKKTRNWVSIFHFTSNSFQ